MTKASASRDDQNGNTESDGSKELSKAQIYELYSEFYNRMDEEEEVNNLDNYLDRE